MQLSSLPRTTPMIAIALWACTTDAGLTQPPQEPQRPTAAPAVIALVSGSGQVRRSGEHLEDPLVVRVTDAQGNGVGKVPVAWSVTSGDGDFAAPGGWTVRTMTTTAADGRAQVFFRPTALGMTTVAASVEGLEIPPVTFTASSTFLRIYAGYWYGIGFGPPDVTVPVGTTIEWLNPYDGRPHTITSSSVPAGEASFASGTLDLHDSFRFIPEVAGTWEYFCEIHGAEEESGTISTQ